MRDGPSGLRKHFRYVLVTRENGSARRPLYSSALFEMSERKQLYPIWIELMYSTRCCVGMKRKLIACATGHTFHDPVTCAAFGGGRRQRVARARATETNCAEGLRRRIAPTNCAAGLRARRRACVINSFWTLSTT